MDLEKSYDSFKKLYKKLEKDVKNNNIRRKDINEALNMTKEEKEISFLNNYFIFKKEKNVDAESIYSNYTSDLTENIKKKLKIRFNLYNISKPVKIPNKRIILIE